MNSLVEFNLDDLINAAEVVGWEVELVTKHFPGKEGVIFNNEGEAKILYIPSYCNIKMSINTGSEEPVVFYESYIKEHGPKYWTFWDETPNNKEHRNILLLKRLGIPYSTV